MADLLETHMHIHTYINGERVYTVHLHSDACHCSLIRLRTLNESVSYNESIEYGSRFMFAFTHIGGGTIPMLFDACANDPRTINIPCHIVYSDDTAEFTHYQDNSSDDETAMIL